MATQCFREDSSWTPERMDLDDLLVVALDLLRSHDLGASDALTILQARFSHGSHEPDTDTVVYSHTQDGAPALVVRYGTRGRVAALEAGSALTADDLTELINSLTAERPPRVWALVAFSSVPTEGSWRYADRMQITPVPPEPPTAPFLLADHPFVIEVAYAGAEDWHLDMRRAQAAAREVSRLLAGFLRHVDDRTGHFSRSEWVFEPAHDEGGQLSMTTRFAQLGYVAEGVGGRSEQFSDTSDMPAVRRVPASEYYANAGITVGESLSLPDSLEAVLDAYFAADPLVQERVLRWCHWLNHASDVWHLSPSASHIAVIQAVEALMPPAPDSPRCPCCGLMQGARPTRRFGDFLDNFAPGAEQATARAELYRLRSGLAHGGKLLTGELAGHALADFTPRAWEERSMLGLAQRLARIVGINWLLSSATTPS